MDLQNETNHKQLLVSDERVELDEAVFEPSPKFLQKFSPGCLLRYLNTFFIVADSSLNSNTSERELSEFTTTYNELKSQKNED